MQYSEKGFYCIFTCILLLVSSPVCIAWGERGHDIVARVAARLVSASQGPQASRPFQKREFMLGHLANVPDIIWKAEGMDSQVIRSNRPTHYINLDLLISRPENISDIPLEFTRLRALATDKGITQRDKIGSAPWRIAQLYGLMKQDFILAGQAGNDEAMIKHVNAALLYGGLMAHFVGDMANPHHTTMDHDGQFTGNGGLHAYFESYMVDELPLDLVHSVYQAAVKPGLIERTLLAGYSNKERRAVRANPLKLALALSLDSYRHLGELVRLDDEHSLLARSDAANPVAKRKPGRAVSHIYEPFIIDRLALGSAVLAELWLLAWQQAGAPDLSRYHSFYYPAAPAYIYPDYE